MSSSTGCAPTRTPTSHVMRSARLLAAGAVACWTWYPIRNAEWLRAHPRGAARAAGPTAQGPGDLAAGAARLRADMGLERAVRQRERRRRRVRDAVRARARADFLLLMFAIGLFRVVARHPVLETRASPAAGADLVGPADRVRDPGPRLSYAFVLRHRRAAGRDAGGRGAAGGRRGLGGAPPSRLGAERGRASETDEVLLPSGTPDRAPDSISARSGASGSSFGFASPGASAKCAPSKAVDRNRSPGSSRPRNGRPGMRPRMVCAICIHCAASTRRARAAVGDDLDRVLGQQQVDQHAVVVLGVPDPQLAEQARSRAASRAAAPRRM